MPAQDPAIDVGATGAGTGLNWHLLIAVIACMTVFDVTLGLTFPLLALVMEGWGVDATLIGLNAAMSPLGLVATAPLVPPLARRFGTANFSIACILATATILLLLKLLPNVPAWFLLRFLLGISIGGLFTVSEAWINELATKATRGRVIALYTSLLAAGFAAGPFILRETGSEGWPPFVIGIVCAFLGLVPLLLARKAIPAPKPHESASLVSFLPKAPTLLLAVVTFAIFDTVCMSLLPLYGLRNGLDEATAVQVLGVLIVGNVVLQFVIGWLADRIERRLVLIGCAALTVLGSALLPALLHSWWLWPHLFVWGATAFGVYTMAMAELGDRFTGAVLLAGTAAFAAMWGIGGIFGPTLGGAAMDRFGPGALPVILGAAYLVLTGTALLRRRSR